MPMSERIQAQVPRKMEFHGLVRRLCLQHSFELPRQRERWVREIFRYQTSSCSAFLGEQEYEYKGTVLVWLIRTPTSEDKAVVVSYGLEILLMLESFPLVDRISIFECQLQSSVCPFKNYAFYFHINPAYFYE